MNADSLLPLIFIFIAAGLIGALISLIDLLPPLREWGQRSVRTRVAMIFMLGLITFAVSFGAWTRLMVEVDYRMPLFAYVLLPGGGIPPPPDWSKDYQRNESAVKGEMWVRVLISPLFRRPCYSSQAKICQFVDDAYAMCRNLCFGWRSSLWAVGLGVISVLVNSAGVWLFTRQHRTGNEGGLTSG